MPDVSTHWEDCWRVHEECRPICDECDEPVERMLLWQQPVEGGCAIAKGHRGCIEAAWGPHVFDGPDVPVSDAGTMEP